MAMKVRVLLSAVVILVTMSLAGCGHYTCGATFGNSSCTASGPPSISQSGGTTGAIAYGYFIDFQNGKGMAEQKLVMGTGGSFTTITSFTPPLLPALPTQMVTVQKKFLYISSADGTVTGNLIDPTTGFMTLVPNSPTNVAGGSSIAADPSGQHIFVGDVSGQQISVFTVNADGSLTAVAGSPFATSGMAPKVIVTDGTGKFLYASDGGASGLLGAFAISATGGLTPVTGNPFSIYTAKIAGEASGKFLLGVTGLSGDNRVHVLAIAADGTLAEVSGSPFTTVYPPMDLVVHPNGSWVYTFNGDILGALNPMEGYQLNNTSGGLTPLSGSPYNLFAAGGPIEQSGQFMFGLGQTDISGTTNSTVTAYGIDPSTGFLSDTLGSLGFPGTAEATYVVTDAP